MPQLGPLPWGTFFFLSVFPIMITVIMSSEIKGGGGTQMINLAETLKVSVW